MVHHRLRPVVFALVCLSLTCPVAAADSPTRRSGRVRLEGRSLADDGGKFNALGASLFYGAWDYRHDRPRLERNLKTLSRSGFDYVRVLGVVGDPSAPDSWDGRESDWRDPDYPKTLAGLADLAYDSYGLRVEWTLIGDGQKNTPQRADRFRLADTFLAMSRGREHKIIHFEIANEAWQNGFAGREGEEQLRELTRYMNDRTDVLVAASAGADPEQTKRLYAGGVADVATVHFDRDVSKIEGHWRPVRQAWEHQFSGLPVGSSNEPIGPGSSVAAENDPVKLVAAAIVTYVSGLPMYVYHSKAGIRGHEDLADMPGVGSFVHLKKVVPPDLASWTPKNAHWPDSPFRVYARDAAGKLVPDKMWPDLKGGSGAVRIYAAINGDAFFAVAIGVKGAVTLEPRRAAEFDVIDPMTAEVLRRTAVAAKSASTWWGVTSSSCAGDSDNWRSFARSRPHHAGSSAAPAQRRPGCACPSRKWRGIRGRIRGRVQRGNPGRRGLVTLVRLPRRGERSLTSLLPDCLSPFPLPRVQGRGYQQRKALTPALFRSTGRGSNIRALESSQAIAFGTL